MAKTPQELYDERKKLYEEQYAEQQRLNEQSAVDARAALQKQLASQRDAYAKGIQAAQESGFSRGRNLLNSLAGRGLATSGLMQLGDVQSRLATGKTLSDLAGANRAVQEAGMESGRAIETNLAAQKRQAGLDLRTGLLASDEALAAQEQEALANKQNAAIALLEAAASGNLSDEQLQSLKDIYGATTIEQIQATEVPSTETTDVAGERSFEDKEGFWDSALGLFNPARAGIYGQLVDWFGGGKGGFFSAGTDNLNITMPDGTKKPFKNWDDLTAYVKETYKDNQYIKSGQIKVGKKGDAVKFYIEGGTGTYYSTLNEAIAVLKGTATK